MKKLKVRDNKGRFVKGHYSISTWIKGSKHSKITKQKMSIADKNIPNHNGRFQKGQRQSPEIIIRAGLGHKGKHNSPLTEFKKGEHRNPSTEFKKGNIPPLKNRKGIHVSPNTEFKKGHHFTKKQMEKVRSSWHRKPTKPEKYLLIILDKYFPHEWKYTGDYTYWIENFNPDFININGKKLIIEFDGKYWHSLKGMIIKDILRNQAYKKQGYDILSLNESDLTNEEKLINKISLFGVV